MNSIVLKFGLVGCCVAGIFAQSVASPIEYVFKGLATGTVGNTQVTESAYTIRLLGDTSNVTNPAAGVFENIGSATFSFQDGPSGWFTGPTQVFDNQTSGGLVGFTAKNPTNLNDVIQIWGNDIGSGFFTTYDLTSGTPLMGPGANKSLVSFHDVATNLGDMSLSWMAENTFQASPVPEPASMAVLGLSVIGLIKRRKK